MFVIDELLVFWVAAYYVDGCKSTIEDRSVQETTKPTTTTRILNLLNKITKPT